MMLSLLAAVGLAASLFAAARQVTPPSHETVVTPVSGPSNFHRLGIDFDTSAMGRTGLWGPSPESYVGPPVDFEFTRNVPRTMTVSGEEIYRVSCRGCHKADGSGTPPEINSVIGPVQATSPVFMEQMMKQRGRPITPAFARELASGSKADLLNRLKNGGQKMPPFGYLSSDEVSALISYLYFLSNVPGAGKVATITETSSRVGELLMKGTCHTCHDAAGNWPDSQRLLEGAIPPMSGFTVHKTLPEFMWKVRHGAPIVMGSIDISYRGRMPVFDYLTDDEVASAYMYLMEYPPQVASRPAMGQRAR